LATKISVFVHCGNRLLRESIARILNKKGEFEVSVFASTAGANSPDMTSPSVIILDSIQSALSPGVCQLRSEKSHLKLLLIAMEDDEKHFLSAIRSGALGYVLQEASAVDVVSAVRAVAQGDAVCPPHLVKVLFDYVRSDAQNNSKVRPSARLSLTRREQQLIPLISRGLTNKQIASHFSLSEQTIKNHIHRILRKVGVEDRLAVLEAYEHQSLIS
jgi:two-component system, NarL family, response regulator DevR